MSHIFISYSRKDVDFAQKIVTTLADNNLDTWIDWKSIPKGEDWEQEIYHGIEEADAFLFLISPDSVASQMCNKEIDHAVKNGKRILPIVVRDADLKSVHPEISKRNWIFCRYKKEPPDIIVVLDNFNDAIEETRKTIHTDYEWLKFHTKLQLSSLEWERHDDESFLLRGKELQDAEKQFGLAGKAKDPQPTDLQRRFVMESRSSEDRRKARELRQAQNLAEEQKKRAEEKEISATHNRNLAFLMAGIAIIAAIFLIATIWLGGQTGIALANEQKAKETAQAETIRAEEQARRAISQQIISQAGQQDINTGVGLQLNALLSIEGVLDATTIESNNSLRQFLDISQAPITRLELNSNPDIVVLSSDRKTIVAYTAASGIFIYNASTGELVWKIDITDVNSLHMSPDNHTLAVASIYSVWIVDLSARKSFILIENTPEMFEAISFSTSGKHFAAGDADGNISIWRVSNWSQLAQMENPQGGTTNDITSLAFNPDDTILATGDNHGNLHLWSVSDQSIISEFHLNDGITEISFSSKSKLLAIGDVGGTGYTINNNILSALFNGTAPIVSVQFSPDEAKVLFGNENGIIFVKNLVTNTENYFTIPKGVLSEANEFSESNDTENIIFSSDGKQIAAGSVDGIVMVWDLISGKIISRFLTSGSVYFVRFEKTNKFL